ncbi:hypothetical protein JCM17846_08730 [Iodidimonas nitroreducens]|uniref:Uncharacterized protein n=1 Tax=Iodidimonas nitroreducens TaxID=1236968 RepID=A0A5A7N4L9_9PROT|nr:hypothetical protein [Iodidimonas nitroreducens]GER03191.1 hypothetical protein JCM17846_08730 [Iodidimonas nitroreducens]
MIPGKPPQEQIDDDDSPLNITVDTVSHIIERVQEAYGDLPMIMKGTGMWM